MIEYLDFEKTSAHFKNKKRALLRPNQFSDCAKKDADISVTVLNCFFNGKCYELFAQTKSGKEIIIYYHHAKAKKNNYF
ncbi:MAG: hypothetical protein IPJ32_07140 [Sphingobacteriaceae bacterium]|nr:hypothetical protein [Sphingobacteriaceae bacterium]